MRFVVVIPFRGVRSSTSKSAIY